jgi:hypothetical protein
MKTVSHPRAMKPSWAMVCSFAAAALRENGTFFEFSL